MARHSRRSSSPASSASSSNRGSSESHDRSDLEGLLSSDDDDNNTDGKQHKHGSKDKAEGKRKKLIWAGVGLLIVVLLGGIVAWLFSSGRINLGGGSSSDTSESQSSGGGIGSGSAAGSASATAAAGNLAVSESGAQSGGTTSSATGNSSATVATTGGGAAPTAVAGAASANAGGGSAKASGTVGQSATVVDGQTAKPVFTNQVGATAGESPSPTTTEKPKATVSFEDSAPSALPSRGVPDGATVLHVDFSKLSNEVSLAQLLDKAGLFINEYEVESTPRSYAYVSSQVDVSDNLLRLKVSPPKDDESKVPSAQLATRAENVTACLLTTRAKLSSIQGITQSVQIGNYLEMGMRSSYYSSTGGVRGVTPGIMATVLSDQEGGSGAVFYADYVDDSGESFDPSEGAHEYGLYWTPKFAAIYIDGMHAKSIDKNVPQNPSQLHWNAFSNGAAAYSAGPPGEDAFYAIEWIDGWILTA